MHTRKPSPLGPGAFPAHLCLGSRIWVMAARAAGRAVPRSVITRSHFTSRAQQMSHLRWALLCHCLSPAGSAPSAGPKAAAGMHMNWAGSHRDHVLFTRSTAAVQACSLSFGGITPPFLQVKFISKLCKYGRWSALPISQLQSTEESTANSFHSLDWEFKLQLGSFAVFSDNDTLLVGGL